MRGASRRDRIGFDATGCGPNLPPSQINLPRCLICKTSLLGRRTDAKFCGGNCRQAHFRECVGRLDDLEATVTIDKHLRDALIESNHLNMQDERDAGAVRQSLFDMLADFTARHS
jgi:hypothetical protein